MWHVGACVFSVMVLLLRINLVSFDFDCVCWICVFLEYLQISVSTLCVQSVLPSFCGSKLFLINFTPRFSDILNCLKSKS